MTDDQVEVVPSILGTKDFWDSRYAMELDNFLECGDEGEVWFGRSSENRILKYLAESKTDKSAKIVDLGCGNGSVLRRLRERGYTCLMGVDYSPAAIELSRKTAEQEGSDEKTGIVIHFQVLDLLSPPKNFFMGQYDFLLDKGTWDAMSLSEDRNYRCDMYKEAVLKGLKCGGKLIIVSCNFTKSELISMFESDKLVFDTEIPALTSFSFSGKEGVTSTGVVFTKS